MWNSLTSAAFNVLERHCLMIARFDDVLNRTLELLSQPLRTIAANQAEVKPSRAKQETFSVLRARTSSDVALSTVHSKAMMSEKMQTTESNLQFLSATTDVSECGQQQTLAA